MKRWWPAALIVAAWIWPQERAEDWALKSAAMMMVATIMGAVAAWRASRRPVDRTALGWWAALAGWCALTCLWSVDPVRSVGQTMVVASLAFALTVGGIRVQARVVAWSWLAVAVVESLVVLSQVVGSSRGQRFSGSFVDANHLGALEAGAAIIAFLMARSTRGPISLMLAMICGLAVLAVGVSGSRGAALALVVGYGILVSLHGTPDLFPWNWSLLFPGGWISLMVFVFVFYSSAMARFFTFDPSKDPLAWKRWSLWWASFRVLVEHPVGTGLGGFGDALGIMNLGGGAGRFSTEFSHSEPIQWMCEAGLPGLALGAVFLVILARRMRRPVTGNTSAKGLAAALAGMSVVALVEFPLHVPVLGWLAVLGLLGLKDHEPTRIRQLVTKSGGRFWVAGLAAVACLWIGLAGVTDREFAIGAKLAAAGDQAGAVVRFRTALLFLPVHAGALQGLAVLEPLDPASAARLALARRMRPGWISPPVRTPPDWKPVIVGAR